MRGLSKPTALIGWRQLNEATRSPPGHHVVTRAAATRAWFSLVVLSFWDIFCQNPMIGLLDMPILSSAQRMSDLAQSGSVWLQMRQICHFLRSVSVHFGSVCQVVLKLILAKMHRN